jgi:hypothetical protein
MGGKAVLRLLLLLLLLVLLLGGCSGKSNDTIQAVPRILQFEEFGTRITFHTDSLRYHITSEGLSVRTPPLSGYDWAIHIDCHYGTYFLYKNEFVNGELVGQHITRTFPRLDPKNQVEKVCEYALFRAKQGEEK